MSRRPPRNAASKLIVALDCATLRDALRIATPLRGAVRHLKVGSPLFTAEGPVAIRKLRALGFDIFLDLKFHDIPSTVEKSCRAAAQHQVWMLTVHASGQPQMLEAAAQGVRREASRLGVRRPLVVGVTILTSVDMGQRTSGARSVKALAAASQRAGLDGVVASAHEARWLRRQLGPRGLIVCPGIRLAGDSAADQRRIVSPHEALARGADFLVVGRPITEAADPLASTRRILHAMEGETQC